MSCFWTIMNRDIIFTKEISDVFVTVLSFKRISVRLLNGYANDAFATHVAKKIALFRS